MAWGQGQPRAAAPAPAPRQPVAPPQPAQDSRGAHGSGDKSKLVSIGGLWEKEGKKGRFFTGQIQESEGSTKKLSVIVFAHEQKKGNEPDWNIMINPSDPYGEQYRKDHPRR